ncbi:MAG: response regulator transcription factor [Sphingobacteriales bacterium]|nr:MAG: response regulator transcription factor [Sphingobacteriales bacterium]
MLKVVIVEDEKKSREVLKTLLEEFCPEVQIDGIAGSVEEGIRVVKATRPDLVFLDIEMQSATGFDLLQALDTLDFDVIFTTAYEQYALKAIKFSAVDYLLKPIDVMELKNAIQKCLARNNKKDINQNLIELLNNIRSDKPKSISISTSEGIVFIDSEDIIRCEAHGAYTTLFLKDGNKILASKNLKEYESLLNETLFFRVHNSHLINIKEVKRYIKSDGGYIEMKDGSRVNISQHKKEEFIERMRAI